MYDAKRFKHRAMAAALKVSAFALLAAVSLAPSDAAAQQKIKISFAHLGTSSGPVIQGAFAPLAKELEATGKVEFTYYGAGSAYSNPLKYPELIEQGVIDMAYGAHQFNAGQFPLNLLMVEPFLVTDHVKASRAFMKLIQSVPELKAEYGRLRILSVNFTPPEAIHSVSPIKRAEDLKGKRILSTHPALIEVLRSLGSSVVVLPSTAQYENLQKGVIDGSSSTHQSIAAFKLAEVAKYHLTWNVAGQISYTAMNHEKYESLPPDIKAIFDKYSTLEAAEMVAKTWITGDELGLKMVRDANGEVYVLPPAEREALREQLKPVLEKRIADAEKKNPAARRVFDAIVKGLAEEQK